MRGATRSSFKTKLGPYRVVSATATHQTNKLTNYMLTSGTSLHKGRYAPTRGASTGKPTANSTAPSRELPSSGPSEFVEEISDSSNSDAERYTGSDDEGDAIKHEITAAKTNPATLEKVLDHSSGVCTLSSNPQTTSYGQRMFGPS